MAVDDSWILPLLTSRQSAGVILYMMVVGKLPFMEHSDSATLVKIMDVDYRRPANISKECQDLLVKLLVRDPALRITTDEVLKHPFFAGEPIPMPMRQTNINLTPDDHEAVVRIMATVRIGPLNDLPLPTHAHTRRISSAGQLLILWCSRERA